MVLRLLVCICRRHGGRQRVLAAVLAGSDDGAELIGKQLYEGDEREHPATHALCERHGVVAADAAVEVCELSWRRESALDTHERSGNCRISDFPFVFLN